MGLLRVLTLVRLATVVLVVAAIVAQAKVSMDAGAFDPTRFFGYFTIQSNLIGVLTFLLLLSSRGAQRSRGLELLRGAACLYLTVTFFVVLVLLSNIDVGLQLPWVDVVLHKVFPIVIVADFLLDPPHTRFDLRDSILWLIYPLIWTAVTMVRGALDGWYPYPFLDPAKGGYGAVAIAMVGILVGFLVLSAVFVAVANWRSPASRDWSPAR